jgi:dihydroflavonol-4-reductase
MGERHHRVLLTGATGFVGGGVARALLAAGHEVVALVRSPERGRDLASAGAELAVGDMLDPSSYRPLVERVDAVVHTAQYAAGGRLTAARHARLRGADHVMTEALAQECQARGKRLVYTSGCFNYGDRGAEPITEDTPFAPSPLGRGHAAEVLALRERHRAGLDVVVLSPGFVYGPGGLFKASFWDQAVANRLRCIGAGDNHWSCVHRDDLAAAFVTALHDAPPGAEYNVVDGHPITLRTLVDQVTDGMGRERVGTIPPFLMGLIIGRPVVDSLTTSFRIGNDRIREQLGWAPQHPTFADGLVPTLAALGAPAARA